ncbi:MAG: DUF5668 domain-containing protein [Spirochaetales bacterium]|jgi:hypothetical protein|nr:DUF5668 domain-containing protein [Spirochaetales bacterium]
MKKIVIHFPRKMLIAGLIFLVAGAALLLRTTGFLTANLSLWPTVLVLIGLVLLHRVYFKNGADAHVFNGIFLILAGAFLLVLNTGVLESDFKQFWPLFMLFVGVSLFFFAFKKRRGAARTRMIVPAAAIALLSLLFLLFSLRVVSMSLRHFVVIWWPGILVFAGALLIILDVMVERRERKKNPQSGAE